ncbi:MAG: 16S rRNA (cytidine(1402)-2'-O)-methyltransferase [Candidatus Binataceae bacterium]
MAEKDQRSNTGVLFVVGMPIGNLDDLSPRALATLRAARLIACEDTRRTGRLLAEHRITTPIRSYFEHNEERRVPEIVARLVEGDSVALVTDAGTPAISDPGYRLVRAALEAGIVVKAVPGPSAVIAALSIAGLPTDRFVFEGFVPQREGTRRDRLEALAHETRTFVFLEAARRLKATLAEMTLVFGAARQAAVVREITKTYEETVRGSLEELTAMFTKREALGEITLVIEGAPRSQTESRDFDETVAMAAMCEAGLSLKQASGVVAKLLGTGRREIYQRALRTRESR